MPGRAPSAKRRTSGKAAFSASSVGGAARSVRGSSPTAVRSADSRDASAAAVVLKSATRSRSLPGSATSASETMPWSRIQSPRSPGRLPSSASETIAVNLYAAGWYFSDSLNALAPPASCALPTSWKTVCRSLRVSLFSARSTSSNCTGVAVRPTGIVAPSSSSSAPPLPGDRSTKKLPSRKIRGRIRALASSCTGRPLSRIASVTVADSAPGRVCSTDVTSPTSTPAIRTGECGSMPAESRKAALIVYGSLTNGMSFANAKYVTRTATHEQRRADDERCRSALAPHGSTDGAIPLGSGEKDWPSGTRGAAGVRRPLRAGRAVVARHAVLVEVAALAALAVGVAVLVDRAHEVGLMDGDGVAEERVLDRIDLTAAGGAHRPEARERVLLLDRHVLDLDALDGAGRVLLGEVVGEVRPGGVEVVADRDVRADVAQRRVQRLHRVGEPGERLVGRRRLREVAQRAQRALEILGELRRAAQHRDARGERAVDGRQARAQLARGAAHLVRQAREVGEERARVGQRHDPDVERAGRARDRLLQRLAGRARTPRTCRPSR